MKFKYTLLVVLLVTLAFGLNAEKKFTNFKLENEKSKTVRLADVTDQELTVIDFWASYCDPCKKALPHLEALQTEYENLNVVVISIDNPRLRRKAMAYIKSKKYTFTTLYDTNNKVADKMKVKEIPYTFLIDKDGNILFEFSSGKVGSIETLKAEINKYIKPINAEECVEVEAPESE